MNSSAAALIEQATRYGVVLEVDGKRLVCRPRGGLPPSLKRKLAERKAEILAVLQGDSDAECPKRAVGGTRETRETQGGTGSAGLVGAAGRHSRDVSKLDATPISTVRAAPCYGCGGAEFWAVARVGNWVCAACHEQDDRPAELVWTRVRVPASPIGSGRTDRDCKCCRGSGIETLPGGGWTICGCRERGFAPENPDVGNGGAS
jgi:hypothetical protein